MSPVSTEFHVLINPGWPAASTAVLFVAYYLKSYGLRDGRGRQHKLHGCVLIYLPNHARFTPDIPSIPEIQDGKVLHNLRRQCFLSVFLSCSREVNFPRTSTFLGSQLSQIFPRESNFPKGVNFSSGSQLFPRKSTFYEEVNFSRGSKFFPRK